MKTFEEFVGESKLKLNRSSKSYKSGDGFTIFTSSDKTHFEIQVNHSAAWSTASYDTNRLILMDAGKERANIYLDSDFRVSDITDRMYELTEKTTWGETMGFSKNDYLEIFKIWLDMKQKRSQH